MDANGNWEEDDDEEFEFSRNYFLAKELASSSAKKSKHKITDIDVVDEQVSLVICDSQQRCSCSIPLHSVQSLCDFVFFFFFIGKC